MTASLRERVMHEFQRRFGESPAIIARAPGRVNLIGDHTDYNDGFVLPMAIDRAVWIALRPRSDARVALHSLDFNESVEFELTGEMERRTGWQEYVRGVAWALRERGAAVLRGWEGVVCGDVPLGAGLSSSAALELATARAFSGVSNIPWQPVEMALLAQRAENQFVGVNCGIMDQLISSAGQAGHALLIDCRSLTTTAVEIPDKASVVVLDTGTRRGLVDSLYNERRSRCEAAAQFFGVKALRDVDDALFASREAELDPITRKRARHVIGENRRTVEASKALALGAVERLGTLMIESHASLRDDFEVSRSELDTMVNLALAYDGCYGARMTGAGFGGCAVALVEARVAPAFARDLAASYGTTTGLTPAVYVCAAAPGASLERV